MLVKQRQQDVPDTLLKHFILYIVIVQLKLLILTNWEVEILAKFMETFKGSSFCFS